MRFKISQDALIFCSILATLSTAYSSVLLTPFIRHDEAMFWFKIPNYPLFHPYHEFIVFLGRPLGAYILTASCFFVDTIIDLNILRFINVIQLSICGFLCFRLLKRYLLSTFDSFLVAVMIFTLPSFQILVSYVGSSYAIPGILLSLCAGLSARRIPFDTISLSKKIFNKYSFISIAFLILALSIYQPAAMFYWAAVALILSAIASEPFQKIRRQAIILFGVGLAAMALYAVVLRLTHNPHSRFENAFHSYNPMKFEVNVAERLTSFIKMPLFDALNLWDIFHKKVFAIIIISLILGAGVIFFVRVARQGKDGTKNSILTKSYLFIFLFLCLVPLSFFPNLISAQFIPSYRCYTGLAALILIVLLWAMNQWVLFFPRKNTKIFLTSVLLITCIFAIIKTNHNLLYYQAIPGQSELTYLENAVKKGDAAHFRQLHIIPADCTNLNYRYDEFAIPTTYFFVDTRGLINYLLVKWAKEDHATILYINWSLINDHEANVECLFADLRSNNLQYVFRRRIIHGPKDTKITSHEPTLTIDMGKLYEPPGRLSYLNKKINPTPY